MSRAVMVNIVGRDEHLASIEAFLGRSRSACPRRRLGLMWAVEHSVETSARPEAVWRVWADVDRTAARPNGAEPAV
jgi:hypothetical protein